MTEPITAGEPLTPRKDAGPPPRVARPAPPRRPAQRRPARPPWLRRLVGALLGSAVVLALVVGVGGYIAWQNFTADLPSVEGLRGYQPPVLSRVYAGNDQLVAELATERRIYIPSSA